MMLCKSYRCARHFAGAVQFCPYCGIAQQGAATSVARRRDRPVVVASEPAPSQETAQASNVEQEVAAPAEGGVGAAAGASESPDMVKLARPAPSLASRFPVLAGARAGWTAAIVMVLALLASLGGTGVLVLPTAAYVAVPCDGQIVSELSILVDLPVSVDQSTEAEMLARLSQQLDAAHAGPRRVNLFSTTPQSGDVGRPLFSACTAPSALAWLLSVHGLDAQIKASFVNRVRSGLAAGGTGSQQSALTQVLSDVSVSQYLRAPQNTLVVFSDLVEKSHGFSLLECGSLQDAVRAYRAARAGGVERPKFRNTKVELNVIPDVGVNPGMAQCRKAFWNWYFGDLEGHGARISMNYLPGRQQKNSKP